MSDEEKTKLVNSWTELHQVEPETERHNALFWSFGQMWELTHKEPETAFEIILRILETKGGLRVEANLAAGPLEDLLVEHGSFVIDRIECEAANNPAFRHLLGGVWKNAMKEDIWTRVQACWDRRGWDDVPE